MSILNAGRDLDRKHVINPLTLYKGTVVNNNDKDKQLQRIKVRIRDIHRGVANEDLPWCLPLTMLVGSHSQIGQVGPIPTIGSQVNIWFLDDSPYFPVYTGGSVSDSVKLEDDVLLGADYPHVYGMTDRAGNRWYINAARPDDEGKSLEPDKIEVQFYHHSGALIEITQAGDFLFTSARDTIMKARRNFRIEAGGTFTAVAQGQSRLHSHNSVDVDSSGRIDLNTRKSPQQVNVNPTPRDKPDLDMERLSDEVDTDY